MRKGQNSVIVIHQRIDPESRAGSRGSAWIATVIVDGVEHSARSRSGAPFELARQLIAAGVEDQPARVYTDGIKGFITYKSLAKMAELTIAESATKCVRTQKWREYDAVEVQDRVKGNSGRSHPSDEEAHKNPDGRPLAAEASE
jgi:hypothetical protein